MDNKQSIIETIVTPELYFLITKFLTAGPLQETAKILKAELENKQVLPKRTDWLGNEHDQTFAELEQKYSHIGANHLLEICSRIGPILDKELPPSVSGILSLLGAGRQSLLRTRDTIYRSRTLLDYCTRIHGVSLPDSKLTKPVHNIQNVLFGREYGGPVHRKMLMPTSVYGKAKLLRRTVGHLSSVYCVLFDRTGRYIITGADDLLVKIWSAMDGRLLATLRGASAEITDIAINLDNTMLAAGSIDRILRVWDLQTASPIAVLTGHTGMITSVNFCPSPRTDLKYLVTTSTDGSIAFWQYSTPRGQKITFAPKPIQYHEKLRPGQAQMMCATFSPGGMFLAAGSADHHVRVYLMGEDGPKRILETEAYTDAVDSVQWAHRSLRFITGSKDGTAHIWSFDTQQWKNVKLSMTERLPYCPEPEEGKKLKVTMVAWDYSDNYAITAANDFTIKIWNAKTAKLHCVLRGHKDELYVLESNPKDKHVLLSAGHDGQVFLWDIERGVALARFLNDIDGQGHGGVFDAKWSPDGSMIAATDSHGHLIIFGLGYGIDKYKILPTELFFHTDYRPLMRDSSHHVVDEQTQIMPHLMPPPFLVDAYGSPHPASFQHYVPGRENCSSDQLIPHIIMAPDGVIVDDNLNVQQQPMGNAGNYSHIDRLIAALANRSGVAPAAEPAAPAADQNRSQLDRMIEALAHRQGQERVSDSGNRAASVGGGDGGGRSSALDVAGNQLRSPGSTARQAPTWGRPLAEQRPQQQQQQTSPQQALPLKYIRRIYVRPMKYSQLQNLKQTVYAAGQFELQEYKREMRRRPIMISTASSVALQSTLARTRNGRAAGAGQGAGRVGRRRGQGAQQRPATYRTRAARDAEEINAPPMPLEEEEEDESSASSGDTSYSNVEDHLDEDSSEETDSESSDYSDWVADTPGPNLEPPKRSRRKPLARRQTFSDDSSDETTEHATTSAAAAQAKGTKRHKRPAIPPFPNGEIPELYRPSEWLSEFIPRKAPYYPQMGDEIVYFRQGHQRYLDAVRQKKVYKLTHSSEPWNFRTLRDHEFVRVIGIKYEIRPPRLCCLKLAMIDEDGSMSGTSFKIKYHDMPDVLDFLVLRQTYDLAVQRNWSIGDRFRCMIGDGWWMGQIESRHPLSSDYPDSLFMCFRVRWDNGEYEYMSPWDMEPIDENRLPDEVGGAVPVLPEEIRATLYQPKSEEWHRGDRDGSCRRIINGLEQLMRLSIAEHFLAPVDLNIYPDYAYFIEYPIDLTTIKSRFENHFYRRITSAQFDVRYLATNAEKYNRRHTKIIKHARIITDLCLRIIREPNDIDVAPIYHQLVDMYRSSESENDDSDSVVPSTSTGPSTSAAAAARQNVSSTRRSTHARSDGDWRADCRQLLDLLWSRPDSAPFREPVDTIEFPDYLEIVATPMDLRTVKEDLLGGNYDDPLDFAKDVRLIFHNSKNYNTNKRSRIYAMTLRLSALFESHMKTVISDWKSARRRAQKEKNKSSPVGGRDRSSGGGGTSSSSPRKRTPPQRSSMRGALRRNTSRLNAANTATSTRRILHSSEDEDNQYAENKQRRSAATARRNVVAVGSTSGSNRVSSSTSRSRTNNIADDDEHPRGSQRSSTRRRPGRHRAQLDNEDDEDEEEDEEEDSNSDEEEEEEENESSEEDDSDSEEDGDSNEDDDDEKGPRARRRASRKRHHSEEEIDSEESYHPMMNRKAAGRRRLAKKAGKNNQTSVRKRRRLVSDEVDEEEVSSPQKRGRRSATGPSSQADESTQDSTIVGTRSANATPRKVGRPRKVPAANDADDGPSTSSRAAAFQARRPQEPTERQQNARRPTRNVNSRGPADDLQRHAAANDHSYHLPPVSHNRIIESDTDSRDAASARPTRASVKRAILDWAKEDVEEPPEDESEEAEEILPTPTPTKTKNSQSAVSGAHEAVSNSVRQNLNEPSTSRAAAALIAGSPVNGTMRQLRTNRNTKVILEVEEEGEEGDSSAGNDSSHTNNSDDVPLAPYQANKRKHSPQHGSKQQSRKTTTTTTTSPPAPHPLHLQRTRAMPANTLHAVAIRTAAGIHATRSQNAVATSSTSVNSISRSYSSSTHAASVGASSSRVASPSVANQFNYLGDERPTTSAVAMAVATRNSSRVVSRHQRDAADLDSSVDVIQNSTAVIRTILRRHNGVDNRMAATSTTGNREVVSSNLRTRNVSSNGRYAEQQPRRDRMRGGPQHLETETNANDNGDEDRTEEEDNRAGDEGAASDVGTDGGSSRRSAEEESDRKAKGAGSDSSEDDQPLTSYVAATKHQRSTRANTAPSQKRIDQNEETDSENAENQAGRNNKLNKRPKRRRMDEDTDEDYEVYEGSRKNHDKEVRRRYAERRTKRRTDQDGRRGSRRNQKRPRYNEQTDDEEQDDITADKRKPVARRTNSEAAQVDHERRVSVARRNGGANPSHRRVINNDHDLEEDDDEDDTDNSESNEDELQVSVSSRGRVRKISSRARKYLE